MKLRAALAFFTRLPVGKAPLPATFEGVLAWFPIVGLIIGVLVAIVTGISALFLPASVSSLLGCAAWVAITGGLHLDGVADCGDGLLVEAPPVRRLEIMQDSRLGTFGGVALFFVLACKITALAVLAERFQNTTDVVQASLELAICCGTVAVFARCMSVITLRLPSARVGGLGEAMRAGMTPRHEYVTLGCALLVGVLVGKAGLLALGAALLVTLGILRAARLRLGGVTGDVLGCITECAECAALLAWCVLV